MENKTRNDQLQAVWFAAGVAVVIACVERAVVVSIFKQWHMWVFLALNLLLIAILFTSTHPPRTHSNPVPKPNTRQETDRKQPPVAAAEADRREDVVDDGVNVVNLSGEEREEIFFADEEEEEDDGGNDVDDDDEKSSSLLSNEELNEKVEAFISRFRQQYLVSDVKISRSGSGNVCGRAVFSKTITV